MSEVVIKVTNLSKRYRIGLVEKADTFAVQLKNSLMAPIRNLRRISSLNKFNDSDDPSIFWALKGVEFEVKRGEVLGIIGANGAGKSTLLKLLSHITEPTTGEIALNGRVASLLEVGTGFHPELTGRDNVYMNGTILGMTKREIDQKFDEIISFSGIEKHIDTPVKFYSSGMKVRLGFSVAAHLEPEILIIDEVLAVGDIGFQEKCLGKMDEVSRSGRTVLFVSHNMGAVENLCSRAILLHRGEIDYSGSTRDTIRRYVENVSGEKSTKLPEYSDHDFIHLEKIEVASPYGTGVVMNGQKLLIKLAYRAKAPVELERMTIAFHIKKEGSTIFTLNPKLIGVDSFEELGEGGEICCEVPRLQLTPGRYFVSLYLRVNFEKPIRIEGACFFDVENGRFFENGKVPNASGIILVDQNWYSSANKLTS